MNGLSVGSEIVPEGGADPFIKHIVEKFNFNLWHEFAVFHNDRMVKRESGL